MGGVVIEVVTAAGSCTHTIGSMLASPTRIASPEPGTVERKQQMHEQKRQQPHQYTEHQQRHLVYIMITKGIIVLTSVWSR